jgi:16S rRNA (guanine527-N7)-methyltransferase
LAYNFRTMDVIKKYFSELEDDKIAKLNYLADLYKEFNQQVNLVSRKDIENIIPHHILPALAISKVIKASSGSTILDIGTGGGLPGLPLAIIFDKAQFTLIDSIGKKINIVSKIIEKLELKNVKALKLRSQELKDKFDFIIGRGVTKPAEFKKLALKNLKNINHPEAILYLSGGEAKDDFPKKIPLSNYFKEKYFENKFIY